ncbi:hypothetical protein [Kitasatospora sp. NBC_01300]|uniref:DUF7927 domain-containing protein n=1 Tax=Kitasatospora sp. NBC_01300 TaxID=2903574 RepID=UPI00352C3850|nr:DUF11 domain-containing protein [Kitasatospora sp. NBC_01300]
MLLRGVLALLCLVPQGGFALAASVHPQHTAPRLVERNRAQASCTPSGTNTNCVRFTYSGGDQTFTVPAGVSSVYARVFGAGGAGSPRPYYTGQYGGGGGGYTTGTLAVTPGQRLTVTSGQGGVLNSTSSTYGGGGAGGQGFTDASGASATGGSGGGLSAVWNGAYGTTPLLIAGGGGGSSPGADATTPAAGGGGGTNGGQDNQPAASGRGGTQTAGGPAATQTACAAATAGSQYQGGRGASNSGYEGGGGGGGGYYGGGGGACQRSGTLDANGMGGGGSGYNRGTGVTNTQTSNGTNSAGNGQGGTSGGRTDAQYVRGIGDGGGYSNGGNGEVVIEWQTTVGLSITKTADKAGYVPGQPLTYTITVRNAGPAPAVDAAVRDALPSALSGFTWTCAAATANSACGTSSGSGSLDTTATIAANDSVTYTVTGTVPSSTTGTLSNTATVTRPAASTDPNCGPTCSTTLDTPSRPTTGLSVTKTPDKNPYIPGQPLTYTIVVKNSGPSDATGVGVRDTLPASIQNFTWTCAAASGSSCGSSASGTGNIDTTVDIAAGGQVTYTLTGTVPADATGSLDNRATVTPPGGATDPGCTPNCTSTANPIPPGGQATLGISKVLLTNPVVPGQQIQWRVTVTNSGPSRARNVVVSDAVPSGVSGASMKADTGGANCPITNGTATCPAVEIPVGGSLSWTLTGTLSPDATTTPTNIATVTGGPDPATPTRTAVASPTAAPSPQANLTVSKALLTSPVVPGQQVQWQVTVTNNGPSRARNVVVTDTVPSGVTGASMKADTDGTNCPITNGTATCPAVEIPVGGSLTWTLTGTLDANATTTPTNTAIVTGGPDPTTPTHTAVASPTNSPSPQANLTVSKVLLTNPVVPGQQIQWQVTVTNNGPSRARNVVVSDTVPSGVTGASMTADTGGANCPITNGTATCPAVEIPVGGSLTWTLTGTLDTNATTTPTNTAIVTGGPDPSASTHTAVASPTASPSDQASLTVSKALLTNPVVPGQQIQWQVTVTNNGPSRARNVVVTDTVPSGVTGASMKADTDSTNCPITNGTATCPAVEIPVGGSLTWTLTGTLSPDATTTPSNTAIVTGGPDPTTPTHTAVASPTNSPSPQANLTVSKALVTNPVVPGQQIQWQISVTNNGPSQARNVIVTDQVPTGVTNANMAAADGTTCPITNGAATCPGVNIPVGQTLTWTLTGTLDANATSTPTNTAIVTGGPDPATPTHTAVASPTTTPSGQASLAVSKVLLTNPVVPGQQIQWRVSVTNNGPSQARNVVVTDQVPAGVTAASMKADADGANCPITSGTATCPAVQIPVGGSVSWTLTGTLASDATTTPTNTAIVTGGPDPATPTHTAVASPTTTPSGQASLAVSKVLLTNPVVPGQQIQWRVSVTNNGPSTARNVVVTDTVPDGVANPSLARDTDGSLCPITGNRATCPAIDLAVGQSQSYTLTGTLASDATTTPTNTAIVTGGPDPATPTHTAVATPSASPSPQASLTLSKVLVAGSAVPGGPIQWRVTVTNNGPSRARNVVVTDTVPAGVLDPTMAADADDTPCPITGNQAICPAIELAVGQSESYTLTGTLDPNATTTPTNTATATGGPDPATPTHTAVATPSGSPSPRADLSIAKVLLTSPVVPGGPIQWRVTVTNNGPSRARNVVVTDTVPAEVRNPAVTADADGTPCPIAGGTATCPAIEIPADGTASYTVTGTLDAAATGTPVNVASVSGGPDPNPSNNTATATPTETAQPQANLTVTKILLTDPVVPGRPISWRVAVTNRGPSTARGVVVSDRIPDQVVGAMMTVDATGSSCPVSTGTATCPAVEIPVGATATFTLTGMLAQDATTVPGNSATVTGGPDPATPTHTAVASPTGAVTPQANLSLGKVLVTNPVVPGQQIQWRVTVTNNGPSRARNVVVTDRIPAGVSSPTMTSETDGAACTVSGGVATCPAIELEVGQSHSYGLSGVLDPNATVTPTNGATVTGGPDPATPTHTAIASPTATPSPQANLTASKILLTDPVVPGGPIQWRVTVTNHGPSRARNVVVTDRIPDGVDNPAMTDDTSGASCVIAAGVATCPAVEIPAGGTASWTLTGTLDPAATSTPVNTAVVTGGPDPATPTHTAVASPTGPPVQQARLTVSKVLLTNPVVPGQQIQWRVSVTNNGPSQARDVVVTDRVPGGVSGASLTSDSDGAVCPVTAGVATCPTVQIPVGATHSWTLTGTLDPAATSTPVNTAVVTGGPDPATPTHTAVASPTGPPVQEARLTVSKVLLTSPVVAGAPISWRVSVTNDGPSRARNVVVTDRFPQQVDHPVLTSDADGTPCPDSGGVATCPAIDLAVGATATYTLSGTLSPDATEVPVNSAVVTGGPDPATPTHTAVATPTEPITVRHDLHLVKQVSPAKPNPGDKVTYTVTATNRAGSTYHGAVVVDDFAGVLDAAGYDGDAHATIGRISYSPPRLTWTLDLRPGATETLVYTFTVKSDAGGKRLDNRIVSLGDGSNCPASPNRSRRSAQEVPEPSATTGGPCATGITVNPSQPSPSPTGGPLPPTGSDPMPLAGLAAFAMLAAGGLLLTLRRTRR